LPEAAAFPTVAGLKASKLKQALRPAGPLGGKEAGVA